MLDCERSQLLSTKPAEALATLLRASITPRSPTTTPARSAPILLPLDVRPTATRTNSYIIDEVRHLPDHGILFGDPGDCLTDLHHDFEDRNVLEIADIRKQCVDVVA
jgi:hypothetical protein